MRGMNNIHLRTSLMRQRRAQKIYQPRLIIILKNNQPIYNVILKTSKVKTNLHERLQRNCAWPMQPKFILEQSK